MPPGKVAHLDSLSDFSKIVSFKVKLFYKTIATLIFLPNTGSVQFKIYDNVF